jgi:hypothetical protein
VPSERCSIEGQSTEYCGWACLSSDVVRGDLRSIRSTAPQLGISQKALGMLCEDGNVMPKHAGATTHN